MEQKKKLQLKKETVAILNEQGMSHIIGGVGLCVNDAECVEGFQCVERVCVPSGTNFTQNDVKSACIKCDPLPTAHPCDLTSDYMMCIDPTCTK